jgi:hypothetical protein
MTANDNRDLRERFAALRDEDAAGAPSMASVLRGPTARPVRWVPVAVLVTAAAMTAAVLVLRPPGPGPSNEEAVAQAQSISDWTAPTDEWLTLSGLEIPNSVPSLSLSSVTLPDEPHEATSQGDSR